MRKFFFCFLLLVNGNDDVDVDDGMCGNKTLHVEYLCVIRLNIFFLFNWFSFSCSSLIQFIIFL